MTHRKWQQPVSEAAEVAKVEEAETREAELAKPHATQTMFRREPASYTKNSEKLPGNAQTDTHVPGETLKTPNQDIIETL